MPQFENNKIREFKLEIRKDEVSTNWGPGLTSRGQIVWNNDIRDTIQTFDDLLSERVINNRKHLEVIGTHLYRVLFSGEKINKAIRNAYNTSSRDNPTRVILQFAENALELANLPWEYLYAPADDTGNGFFLSDVERFMLSRRLPVLAENMVHQKTPEKVKILLFVSQPAGGSDHRSNTVVAVDEVANYLQINYPDNFLPDTVEVVRQDQPSGKSFKKSIEDEKPDIVHFIGHGDFKDGRGQLVFVNSNNSSREVLDRDISDSFENHQPRLVFLQACNGAQSETYKGFGGVALNLIGQRIPVVVSMRYEIANEMAEHFAVEFYQKLGEYDTVDLAVQLGRHSLRNPNEKGNYEDYSFGCPVIYTATELPAPLFANIMRGHNQETIVKNHSNISVYNGPIKCPYCPEEILPTSPSCTGCGNGFALRCPECGCPISDKQNFCAAERHSLKRTASHGRARQTELQEDAFGSSEPARVGGQSRMGGTRSLNQLVGEKKD